MTDSLESSPGQIIMQAQELRRRYGKGRHAVEGLTGVNLSIRRRERLGIVGESGSGKSTLVRLLAALDRPTSGKVTFDGMPISGVPERHLTELRRNVQLVFQDPRSSLDPRMTVSRIVTEPLRSRLLRKNTLVPPATQHRLYEVLDNVGLDLDLARRYPHELSGGQRQRVAIARALAPAPQVLIADEPVSALDVAVRAHILNLLRDLVDAKGLTLVVVSHDLAMVRHLCDRVVVMKDGNIVEEGPIGAVYNDPQHPYTVRLLSAIPLLKT